tara:strand:+ start:844 stop:2250 length:1407 start_codon:yes stop_codon:yes gene_type:complete
MASWKKVIVSGSDAILNSSTVSTNQVITALQSTTKLSGSFTGSFVGDGTGITGITATGLNIPGTVTEITNQPFVVSGSAALQKITLADITSQITGSGLTKASGTGNTIMLNTSSAHFITGSRTLLFASAYLGYNNSTGIFTFDSGSYGTFSAGAGLTSTNGVHAVGAGNGILSNNDDVALDTASLHFFNAVKSSSFQPGNFVDSAYIDFTVTQGTSVTAVILSSSIQNGHLANSAITFGATSQALGSTVSSLTGLATVYAVNISGSSITGSSRVHSGGDLTAQNLISSSNGNIKADLGFISAGTPASVAPAAIAGEIVSPTARFDNLSVGVLATLTAATVTNNLTVGGDLRVNGTASFINSTNLYVKDQFILLNSGSSTLSDAGLVMGYSASGVGSAFFLESTPGSYGRFAIAYNVSGTATNVTHDSYMVAVSQSAGAPAAIPTWGGTTYGFGNMHVDSGTGDIYIYS